jgi:hypothetical protein
MKDIRDLPFPPIWINEYIKEELNKYGFSVLTIPSSPNAIDDLTKNRVDIPQQYDENGTALSVQWDIAIQYDRLLRFRRDAFYPMKCEQLLYYVYSVPSKIIDAGIIISQLLDRSDAAAEDLNRCCMAKQNGNSPISDSAVPITHNVYFHDIKVYQLEEVRDLTELAALRGLTLNKFVIEYDYHSINQQKIINTAIPDPDINYT